MTYFATVSFDLEGASPNAYEAAEEVLNNLGFSKEIKGTSEKTHTLPSTTYVGKFNGADAGKVRDDLCTSVKNAFAQKNLKSSLFIVVGGDWGWGLRYT